MRKLSLFVLVILIGVFMIQGCGESETKDRLLNAEEFQEKIKDTPGVVIDVRTRKEYNQGHLAVVDNHLDLLNGDFEVSLDSLDKDETVLPHG